jgi:hypothetical protein
LLNRLRAADWPDQVDHGPALHKIVSLLSQGVAAAAAIGEALLHGRTLAVWRKALLSVRAPQSI